MGPAVPLQQIAERAVGLLPRPAGEESTVNETAAAFGQAVGWYAQGADFADALHLAACGSAVMHTFDRDFCKAAREGGIAPVV